MRELTGVVLILCTASSLQDFPSVKPTFEQFIQLLPPLHPRWYTIASSSVAHPNTVHLAVSVIHTAKKGAKGRVLAGVCSNYLETAAVGSVVRCDLRASNFKLPADASKPVILVGPGTGLAPMRAFLQERRFQQQQGQVLGECALYFGCRRRDEDYIYRDELHEYSQDGTITQLITAFSREQQEKVYVQHRLR
jgi:sulfite reductase alpha subunit-like flavoprotein